MASPDHLYGLRNSFYIGAYQAAIASSQSVPAHALSPDEVVERDALLYRSYIAIGSHQLVIDEIGPGAATPLQAVKMLAVYLSGGAGNKESAISKLNELLGDAAVGSNPILRLIAGTIFMHERDYAEALKHTISGGTMELLALNVQIYIQMHRPDHAEKQLRIMQQLDEDHTLTQLANAWVDLVMGGSKIQDAHMIFQDFSDKYPTTCMILNGKALCLMHMGNFEEAEGLLLESLNKISSYDLSLPRWRGGCRSQAPVSSSSHAQWEDTLPPEAVPESSATTSAPDKRAEGRCAPSQQNEKLCHSMYLPTQHGASKTPVSHQD